MVKHLILLIVIFAFSGCLRVPVNKLNYLNNRRYIGKPMVNGSYLHKYETKLYSENGHKYGFLIFYKNGLLKYGAFSLIDSLQLECTVLNIVNKYKDLPYLWGDFKIVGDSIYIEKISSSGMAPRKIEYETGIIENDSVIKIIKNSRLGDTFEEVTYKFIPFETLPDSTGYLYDKLQKKRTK
jgi:hypothetical protein